MARRAKQIAAADRIDQDVCVVAGPGSGKTSVLIERFSWLVNTQGVDPGRILTITFTEKAANEIKRRLVDAFQDGGTAREKIERAYVSTIHAFCDRLQRENAIAAGLDPQFQVVEYGPLKTRRRESADAMLPQFYEARRR